jgi:hypothetical protein
VIISKGMVMDENKINPPKNELSNKDKKKEYQ